MSNSLNEESTSRVLPPLQDLIQHPHSIASTIHDDVLLRIFNFYRLNDEENWNLRFRWRNLAHICRNWRHVILQSPSALDLHLLCKSGIPVANLLAHFPPLLPLVVIYRLWHTSFTDTEDALVALRQSHRVCRVNLQAPSSILHRLLTAMDAPFPKLENLTLLSKTTEDTSLILPRKFLAPTLSKLILQGVALPTTRPLLTFTAIDLVILTL
ncbi:hypothetical protein B0F90DRAFT_573966 [Multifurca ochricompacta]|uniref:F-box domain-containing protein n=1 Tax=Multifurca ochricompacta TaxID=376703 RepID=A0AAD4M4B0_9AGAM|nr:hypothetical protein B0F90DRAFT_573966 [Multifurca ochricompacta]